MRCQSRTGCSNAGNASCGECGHQFCGMHGETRMVEGGSYRANESWATLRARCHDCRDRAGATREREDAALYAKVPGCLVMFVGVLAGLIASIMVFDGSEGLLVGVPVVALGLILLRVASRRA
jgi:hypothetical protein